MSKRYYEHEDKKYPRCTSICGQLDKSGALTQWAANQAVEWIRQNIKPGANFPDEPSCLYAVSEDDLNRARMEFRKVSAEALDIGGQAHSAIEQYLKAGNEPVNPPNQVLSAFLAFLEWLDGWETWRTIRTEFTVYGDRWAGTADWEVYLDGDLWLIDFKSSKKPKQKKGYEEWGYQTAAYRPCTDADFNGVLRLDKEDGYPDFYDLSDSYEQDLTTFNCLVDLWFLRHPKFRQEVE